jgi:hypothetical protein
MSFEALAERFEFLSDWIRTRLFLLQEWDDAPRKPTRHLWVVTPVIFKDCAERVTVRMREDLFEIDDRDCKDGSDRTAFLSWQCAQIGVFLLVPAQARSDEA